MNPSELVEKTLRLAKRLIPKALFRRFQPAYHFLLALAGAIAYRFPAKKLVVIGVTGTKGKSTTVEITNAVLEAAGLRTAAAGTIRFKVAGESWENKFKMTMPGRFFLQRFLRKAVEAGCTHAVVEMTSEGSRLYRYRFAYPDALIFTNISPEHIESHGSYENYLQAKLDLARLVARSGKPRPMVIANGDDKEAGKFLAVGAVEKRAYSLKDAEPYEADDRGVRFAFDGARFESELPGVFNIYNILGALSYAKAVGIGSEAMRKAVSGIRSVRGRMEKITLDPSNPLASAQEFAVVVDYAHTADSLGKAYSVYPDARKICVFGATGGGRDKWKRKEMGRVADENCAEIILTDDDPYDEDPMEIARGVAEGIVRHDPDIIIDRRAAIRAALDRAKRGDVVMITGKGTDAYLMKARGERIPWDDARIAREELEKSLKERHARAS